ncbi:hypothetical protein SAMN04488095_1740 [Jannaschia pohangensis]|uniref:Uncharacterized protein n=1 Tax=Jannaschia pohangensis TaxID=390807 RepID=A0A1I3M6I0_9RHOB|nr:hypothetical protein SAMN04488095_1740 [Jannaschia pohangensis]
MTPEDAEAVTDEALAAFEGEPSVDDTLRETLVAAKDYFEAARADEARRPGLLRRGVKTVGSVLAVLDRSAKGASTYATGAVAIHLWAATPQGQAILAKLVPLLERIVSWFLA